MQVLITSYIRGEEDSTHLALTDRGREVVDTLTVMQLFFISHNMGKDSTSLDCKDTFLQAFLSNSLGSMKGQNITVDLVATEQENNDHLGIHACIKYVHGVENILRLGVACRSTARRNMLAVAIDVKDVGNCS